MLNFKLWWLKALSVFAVMAMATLALRFLPSPWATWAGDGCAEANCYCEGLADSFVLQPVVAYSNWAFWLAGVLIAFAPTARSASPHAPRAVFGLSYAWVYGLALIATGLGSFFSHASLTLIGEWFDLMGLYVLGAVVVLTAWARLRPMSDALLAAAFAVIVVVGGVQMIVARELQQVMFGLLFGAAFLLEGWVVVRRRPRMRYRWLAATLALFAAGGTIWVLTSALPCNPDSFWQAHALWHVLAAAAAGCLYLYFRSESREG